MKRTRMNKKGLGLSIAAVLYLVLAVTLTFSATLEVVTEPIGIKQYDILITNELTKSAQVYIDKSLAYAAQQATDEFVANQGRFVEQTETGEVASNPCGNHIYTIYTNGTHNCLPNFVANYISYLQPTFNDYLASYPSFAMRFGHSLQVQPFNKQTRISGLIHSDLQLPLGTLSQLYDDTQTRVYPSSALGSYGYEKPVTCGSAECFTDVANLFYDLYTLDGAQLPYVWGGESPYTFADSVALTSNPRSIFYQYNGLTEIEPKRTNRVSRVTIPGFDCSGWIWWVGKHAGIEGLNERLTADGFLHKARTTPGSIPICDESKGNVCEQDKILESAQPGDIIFYAANKGANATHIMLYDGDQNVIHSRSKGGLVKEKLTGYYFRDTIAVYRFPYAEDGLDRLNDLGKPEVKTTGVLESPVDTASLDDKSCVLPVDLSQINALALANQPSAQTVIQKLEAAGLMNDVIAAHEAYPSVPAEVIIAFITKETGGVIDRYISRTETCNSVGFCGLMQVGKPACKEVNRIEPGLCDYDQLREGNLRMGIMSGTAYLNYLLTNYNDVQYPDYYWLAVSYNAGPGSMQRIQQAVGDRLSRPAEIVQWQDTTFEDIQVGMNNVGARWARQPEKHDEVWKYPNSAMLALAEQCDGSLVAGYRTRYGRSNSFISYEPTLAHTTNLDLETLTKITSEFIPNITESCTDNLATCTKTFAGQFSSDLFYDINITTGEEPESLALSVVEQALDCKRNGQSGCYCDIVIDPMLRSDYADVALEFLANGDVLIGEEVSNVVHYVADTRTLAQTDLNLTIDKANPSKVHSKTQFFIDETDITIELADVIDDTYKSTDEGAWGIGLYKNTEHDLSWAPLQAEDKSNLCRDNKEFFRFEAAMEQLPEPIRFSIRLNDSVAPQEVVANTPEDHRCGIAKSAIRFSWFVPNTSEQVYEFVLNEKKTGQVVPFHAMRAANYDVPSENKESLRKTFKLFGETTREGTTYYTVIDKDSSGIDINATQYTFTITAIDEYLNERTITMTNGNTDLIITPPETLNTLPASALGVILGENCVDARTPAALDPSNFI